jgi:Flp pilus assembly protein TadG
VIGLRRVGFPLPARLVAGRLRRDKRSSVAVLFALLLIPILGVMGLAIDFALWRQAYSAVRLASDGAALNAAKIAASGELANDPNYVTEGQTAGSQWFVVQVGNLAGSVSSLTPTVTVTSGLNITAKVVASGSVKSIFGNLFGIANYALSVESDAAVQIVPFTDLTLLIDNSPSMMIGATPSDMSTMQQITPCTANTAYIPTSLVTYSSPIEGNVYEAYQCHWIGTYDGSLQCPFPANSPYTFSKFTPVGSNIPGPSCQGYLSKQSPWNLYPLAGAPCAFACHYDTSKPAGLGNDSFALARSTIGTANQVTLRFDVVKAAARQAVSTIQSTNGVSGNIALNIFTFDTNAHPLYPSDGSYGQDWTAALAAIGTTATSPNTADTGIQPFNASLAQPNGDTDFTKTMSTLLQTYLTAGGSGATAASPRKSLILITDGLQDSLSNGTHQAFTTAGCTSLQNLGYTVYVLYTTYYPLMNWTYLRYDMPVVEGSGTGSITGNLTTCASSSNDFIAASDGPAIVTALKTLLGYALTSETRLTR